MTAVWIYIFVLQGIQRKGLMWLKYIVDSYLMFLKWTLDSNNKGEKNLLHWDNGVRTTEIKWVRDNINYRTLN